MIQRSSSHPLFQTEAEFNDGTVDEGDTVEIGSIRREVLRVDVEDPLLIGG